MAVAAWVANTPYAIGDIRRAATAQVTGLFFKCTTAGTSESSEPKWGTIVGSTVTDNTCVWTAISSTYEELSVLAPSAIIELFELHLDSTLHGSTDIYRWHNGCNAAVTGDITWRSQAYSRQPVEATGFESSVGKGTLPRPTLTISNMTDMNITDLVNVAGITALLLFVNKTTPGNDLGGAIVKRIRTLKKYIDGESGADPYAEFPQEIWYVDRKASESRDLVSFELASKFDLPGVNLPRRQIVASVCQWAYKGDGCGYNGTNYFNVNDDPADASTDKCGKKLTSCKLRFEGTGQDGILRFGGFPGAGLVR